MPVHVRQDQNHMATTFELVISCEPERSLAANSVLSEAHVIFAQLENELSAFRPESPVCQLNRAKVGERIPGTRTLIALLSLAEQLKTETFGSFDAGSGIGWDARTLQVWRENEEARLGFGAIGKGYALDRARALIEREGFTDFLLSAGGSSLIVSGWSAPGVPWSWGLSWKKDLEGRPQGLALRHATGQPIAIGVSGTHEKGSHILRNGDSVLDGPACAMVAHRSAAYADALSTAFYVSEGDVWPSWIAEHRAPAARVDRQDVPTWNRAFNDLWGRLDG